ncbi:Reverse transcriptase zinc-binding domain [Sesbania bispinosa]|nr:Reverse transcriptase zinc-binding domain [Sesbania bispinosa]
MGVGENAYWVHVIRSKYHCGEDVIPRIGRRAKESMVWRGIRSTWSYVMEGLRWVIGDGKLARFWEDRCCIQGFYYVSLELGSDSVVWGGTPNGDFSTKSAYNLIENNSGNVSDPGWRAVWRWEGHEQAKCLLWVILNNGLKTRNKGFRRGFMDTNTCALRNSHEETSIHILRDCVKVRELWYKLANGRLSPDFFSSDLREWIFINIGSADWVLSVNQAPKYRQSLVGWSFPKSGWVKVNVDGSVLHNSTSAGCGGMFRGADAWDNGYKQLWLETDSLTTVSLIEKGVTQVILTRVS